MTIGELLDHVRAHYLDRFRDAISEHEATPECRAIIEPAYLDAAGQVVREGVLNLPMRGDIFVVERDKATKSLQVDTESMLGFNPVSFNWEHNLEVRLMPFQWNWCSLEISPAIEELSALVRWFDRWFEGAQGIDEQFSGAVHFLSDPEMNNQSVKLEVDLGSAPTEAFEELLDACVLAGATNVLIGVES